ncbi:hypothetical protein JTB14_010269 [Gonioctena quinquepunctata]|nr:hypothetical protein JTB14_010268 [Gonioctena quinquepunctata]KAG5861802.1 hypothetical protein JTB14_010269 [Gonioctena quinquepunctata]
MVFTKIIIVFAAFTAVVLGATNEIKIVPILHQESEIELDGKYHWSFESGDGIKSHQEGSIQLIDEKPVETVSGYYEYPGAEGKAIRVDYLADKDGFHAKGDAIPQPLPQIQRALDYLATLPPPKEEKYTKA